jgi:hypothetical protein
MAGVKTKKDNAGKSRAPIWTPRACSACADWMLDGKEARRVLVVWYLGTKRQSGYVWQHKSHEGGR